MLGLCAIEEMLSFLATAPLLQYDIAKQNDLVLSTVHTHDACCYFWMATTDILDQSVSGYFVKIRVW